MRGSVDTVECHTAQDGRHLLVELKKPRSARHVLVRAAGVRVDADAVEAMLTAAFSAPIAATVSPVPVSAARPDEVLVVPTDRRLPPPPTMALGCTGACLVSCDAVASVTVNDLPEMTSWKSAFLLLCQRLSHAGWTHIAAPGVVMAWADDYDAIQFDGAWSRAMIEAQNGPANEGLTTHALWSASRMRPIRVLVDGACLTDAPHNGSQAVVVNVSKAIKRARPESNVVLAAPRRFVSHIRAVVGGDGVDVSARDDTLNGFDVVYRPYQLLDPGELEWLAGAAERFLVSQLDMIAFSNPSYHPSAALFHAVRNLQRRTMRFADGVTFISEFGRTTALIECPDLDPSRCFVVSCGTEAMQIDAMSAPEAAPLVDPPFIACLAATFWHKNRPHAISVFAQLCRRHGYSGRLVIAGPEPYYGRSTGDEQALIASLDPDLRDRVIHLGQVDEPTKWWLLRTSDLVLYPSVVEGFGLLPFEAAAAGTPSLSHAGSAVLEVLGDGPAVVPSWNVDAWADAAAQVIGSPERGAEVLAAVGRAAEPHTWAETARLTWEAIDSLLARPHATRHAEEGGLRSHVANDSSPLAPTARAAHFGNRLASYLVRRATKGRTR
jgi:glycosyltransferase involved in cell wall biosynthesis